MQIIDIDEQQQRKRVIKLFYELWGSTKMVISSGVYDIKNLKGFVAVQSNKILGIVTYVSRKNEIEVIFLDSLLENQGIGSKLLIEIEKLCARESKNKIKVITTNDNLHALNFYKKRGYTVLNVLENAVEKARLIKPEIPQVAENGIAIKDEIILQKIISNFESDKIVKSIISNNTDLMNILNIIKKQNLTQSALVAGSIRNTIWQKLHHQPFKLKSDVDVVFFDECIPEKANQEIQNHLEKIAPQYMWQVKNEAYMHNYDFSNQTPFNSVTDAVSHFVETPTCIGAFLDDAHELQLIEPFGTTDLVNLTVRPIPLFKQTDKYFNIYKERLKSKNWQKEWPKLNIII
nr:nucleotidyltransferase family protein [Liquorilactobacillus sicerae]